MAKHPFTYEREIENPSKSWTDYDLKPVYVFAE
jgi:hypothetical protein